MALARRTNKCPLYINKEKKIKQVYSVHKKIPKSTKAEVPKNLHGTTMNVLGKITMFLDDASHNQFLCSIYQFGV